METKNKIGVLLILGGIALLGVYYFKKNKPNVAEQQLKGLQGLFNYYLTGGGVEETWIKGSRPKDPNSYSSSDFNLNNSAQQGFGAKGDEIFIENMNTLNQFTGKDMVLNQIAENMKNADFSNFKINI